MFNSKSVSASQIEVGKLADLGNLQKNRSLQDVYRSKATLGQSESHTILVEKESQLTKEFQKIFEELNQNSLQIKAERQVARDLREMNLIKETSLAMKSEAFTAGANNLYVALTVKNEECELIKQRIELMRQEAEAIYNIENAGPIEKMHHDASSSLFLKFRSLLVKGAKKSERRKSKRLDKRIHA